VRNPDAVRLSHPAGSPPKGTQVIDTCFSITFHNMELFTELLAANNLSVSLLELSLSPCLNRKQVFSAGEGSGKSGSFFFFSHDN